MSWVDFPPGGGSRWRAAPSGGALPAGGPAFSGESRRKEHQGAQPPGSPLRKGGSFPKNLFSGGRVAGRLGLFFWQPACGPHSGRPQGEPPTTWAAGGRGSFPYGENGKNRNDKKKNSGKADTPTSVPEGYVLSVPAAQSVGGSPSEPGAVRAAGRLHRQNLPPPRFPQPREREREGRNLLPSPPGSRGRSPWCSFVWAFSRESPGPRGSGPLESGLPSPASPPGGEPQPSRGRPTPAQTARHTIPHPSS